jgi:hypothetical protein
MGKSTKPIIRIHNTETDEVIDREMTDAEFADYQTMIESANASQAEKEAQAAAKANLLERLGITEDEAKLLLA